MEKKLKSMFRRLSFVKMSREVLNECRRAAIEIPVFKETRNGCYAAMYVPLCPEVDEWFGGMSMYDSDEKAIYIHEYVSVDTVLPGGSHTIQWKDPNTGKVWPTNCLSCAMMKIAYLSRLVKQGIESRELDEEAELYIEEDGYYRHRGAVCTTVSLGKKPLFRVYDAISGASEDEDLQCAMKIAQKRVDLFGELLGRNTLRFAGQNVDEKFSMRPMILENEEDC